MSLKYNIVLSNEIPNVWGAIVLELPGCIACGETEDKVRSLILEAIDIHVGEKIDTTNKIFINSGVISPALDKVIEYCYSSTKDLDFELRYVDTIQDQHLLFELTMISHKLDIKPLLDICCKVIANKIKGKTAEQIRNEFGIEKDLEEAQIKNEFDIYCI